MLASGNVASFFMKTSNIMGHLLIYSLNVHVAGRAYSIANEIPYPENLSYLTRSNGQVMLKQNHQYFSQVQGQLAITKRKWCQFLVNTQKGFYLETIHFDADYVNKMEENLACFHINHLAPVFLSNL